MDLKKFLYPVCILLHAGLVLSELMGPYKCPSDSRCQDIQSCTGAYKKKTSAGKLFYCGPQNRMDFMVCCMEKELNWDQTTGDEMENEILSMLMPTNSQNGSISSKMESIRNRTNFNGPTSIITNILPNEGMFGSDFNSMFEEYEDNEKNGNSIPNSNDGNSYSSNEPLPPSPYGPGVNQHDLKRDSRKSFTECNCPRGPPGPPGPPGADGKVIYVPVLISSSTPAYAIPPEIAASVIPYLTPVNPQPSNPQMYEPLPQPQTSNQMSSHDKMPQNSQRTPQVPSPYNQKGQSSTTNANPSVSSSTLYASLQNKIKRQIL